MTPFTGDQIREQRLEGEAVDAKSPAVCFGEARESLDFQGWLLWV